MTIDKTDKSREKGFPGKKVFTCLPHLQNGLIDRVRPVLDEIFSPEHCPRKTFAAKQKDRGSRYKTPSRKYAAAKVVVYRNPYMHNGLLLLDVDPDVVAIAPFPLVVRFITVDDERRAVWRDHVPDLAVRRRDGRVEFIDFMHDHDAHARVGELNDLAYALHQSAGIIHRVMTATEIVAQPRFYNANVIWNHQPVAGELVSLESVQRDILRQPLPMTISELSAAIDHNVAVVREDGELRTASRPIAAVDIVYTACLRLAYAGRVRLDMNKQISMSTIITKGE